MLHLDPQYAPLDFVMHAGAAAATVILMTLAVAVANARLWLNRLRDTFKGGRNEPR